MDIKAFVAESLLQITEGIQQARKSESGARFCPFSTKGAQGSTSLAVSFDIAVAVTQETGGTNEKLTVMGTPKDNEANAPQLESAFSRISFTVPVLWDDDRPREDSKNVKTQGRSIPDLNISL